MTPCNVVISHILF